MKNLQEEQRNINANQKVQPKNTIAHKIDENTLNKEA